MQSKGRKNCQEISSFGKDATSKGYTANKIAEMN